MGDGELDRVRFEHYLENGAPLFKLSSLKEARCAVLPFHWEQIVDYEIYQSPKGIGVDPGRAAQAFRRAREFAALAASEGKPVIVFFCHDSIAEVPIDNSVVFRTSIQRTARRPNEYAMPYWMTDEVEAGFNGELPLREKTARPVIGFCGPRSSTCRSQRIICRVWPPSRRGMRNLRYARFACLQ